MGRLQDKVCIVTGATSGIGRRTAERFAEEGAILVLAGRRTNLGEELLDELGRDRHRFVTTDVSVEADVAALVAAAVDAHGRVDVLFNNAGGPGPTGGVEGIDVDAFDATFATNVRSVMLGMKHVAPVMKAQQSGSIVNNASIAATRAGYSSSTTYSATKAAVLQFSKCVAMELGEHFVRVNTVSPGAIATGVFAKSMRPDLGNDAADATAAMVGKFFAEAQPIKRAGLPDDIADAVVYLASDESRFVTGTDLVVDGGIIAGRLWSPQQEGIAAMRRAFGTVAD